MSFILDALRKSEHERERRQTPGLAAPPVASAKPSRLPLVLGGVGVLLAVNLVVLLALWARDDGADAPPTAPAASAPAGSAGDTAATAPGVAPPVATTVAPPVTGPVVPPAPREVRSLADEAASGDAVASDFDYVEPPPVPRGEPRARTADRPTLGAAASPPVPADGRIGLAQPPRGTQPRDSRIETLPPGTAPSDVRAGAPGGLPRLDDLTPQATAGLPVLSLNLHVWSADPAQRFVVLNGARYREGTRLAAGPTLERITPEGAVLNHNGLRFLLPRE